MAHFHDAALIGASGQGGYRISRSLRFNSADSAYLNRTPASAGNRKTWTWSGWVKRTVFASSQAVMMNTDGSDRNGLYFNFTSSDTLQIGDYTTGFTWQLVTSQVFRDPSAWFHLVFTFDSTQSTSTDRAKLYINGVQVTALSTASYPSLNYDSFINTTSSVTLGRLGGSSGWFFNGYLTEVNFIDGQALTPSSFGETDTITGVWKPKKYAGTYGTNGFYLNFADNSGTTSTTLGKDSSGNGNNWTPNNFSVTAGAGNDSLVDSPTLYGSDTGAGGEVRGNYCTLNPLDNGGNTVSNGNLVVTTSTGFDLIRSTFVISSGKWYWEVTADDGGEGFIGISSMAEGLNTRGAETTNSATIRTTNGDIRTNATNSAYGSTVADGNTMMFALDMDAGKFWAGNNGTWFNSGSPAAGTNAGKTGLTVPVSPSISVYDNEDYTANFGQRPFAYTAPSGFKALCTTNLPEPTIVKGNTAMDVKLYTGTSATQSITGLNFQPDWVWIKIRNQAYSHNTYDAVRGANQRLRQNQTGAEASVTDQLMSFDSSGFTLGADSGAEVNSSGNTFVAWCWDAGSSTVTNTSGTISSQVRANASAGFSVVTYTGTGANATVGHGLGVAPSMIIFKNRNVGTTDWAVYFKTLVETNSANYVKLNSTSAVATSPSPWNGTLATSSVFSIGTWDSVNGSTNGMVAYCFSAVAGYSAFGSYTGNGSSDGPFVFTGFRPRFVMVKRTDSTGGWWIRDAARSSYNVTAEYLGAHSSSAEASSTFADFTSNGFKLRTTDAGENASGGTYIYAAFAENPFKYSLAR